MSRPVEPTPRSLILDLLSTLGRRAAPVRALVEAAGLFGIRENSLRVALVRLVADGLVERDRRGEYGLGAAAQALNREIRSWRRLEERVARWSGDWLAAHTAALGGGSARERRLRARALRFLGFRPLAPGLELRPANLAGGSVAGGSEGVRERLAGLGLQAPGLVFRIAELDPEGDARARALWDGRALVKSYRATRATLEKSARRLAERPVAAARVESFRLGGAAIRQLVLDPLLPEPIVPAAERRALLEAARRYDRLGRAVWAGWLEGIVDEPRDCPAGVRGPRPGADPWAAAQGA